MSIHVLDLVWKHARYEGGTLLVLLALLALADWADDSGYCYPKVPAIAAKARLGQRQTNNVLKLLGADRVVSVVQPGGGSGRPSGRRINVEMLKSLSLNSDSVKSTTQNPEICDNAIRKNRQEPPEDISSKPNGFDGPPLLRYLLTVWDDYLLRTGRNSRNYAFSPIRKQKGLARLRECVNRTDGDLDKAVELMKGAIAGMVASDWHMGRDAKNGGKRYCEWEKHVFKNYEQMEGWWNQVMEQGGEW